MKNALPILLILSLSACVGTIIKYPIDQKFYNENISKSFLYPKQQCFFAVKKALEYQGFKIEFENMDKGKIVSNRKTYDVNASSQKTVASSGYSYSGGPVTTYHTETSNYLLKESHQFYFDVTGNTAKCDVTAFRWRAWSGVVEMKELQGPGIVWTKDNLFNPFYDEVERFLENKPY
ncbi:MAG: hypothetical protein ACI843_002809 [Psychrobacter glaciei]|jgi:hypothetical protein